MRRFLAVLLAASLTAFAHALPAVAATDADSSITGPEEYLPSTLAPMVPDSGYVPKDFALAYTNGTFHLFYIRHRPGVPEDSTEIDFGHAVWSQRTGWRHLPAVLRVRPGHWDDLHVWAPSLIRDDATATWYLFYTGVTRVPFAYTWYQRIGVATSQDLMTWTRYDAPVFGGNQCTWVFADSSQLAGCQFRDAFVMPDPTSSARHWLMFYAATPAGPTSQLITHVARNDGGLTPWSEVMPLWNTDFFLGGPQPHYVGVTESPHVFENDGRWYLFYTSNSTHRLNFEYASSPLADSTQWSMQYRLYNVLGQDPASDRWYASEYLRVGQRQYFAYVNDARGSIDVREMTWNGPNAFALAPTSVLDAPPPPAPEPAVVLALAGNGSAGAAGVRVTLPAPMSASVRVFDVNGRIARTLHDSPLPAGTSTLAWDHRDDAGRDVPPGVYLVRLETPRGAASAKALVIR